MNAPATLAPGTEAMALSARALTLVVLQGRTAEDAIEQVSPPPAQRAAVRAILAGTLRWSLRLAPALEGLMKQPCTRCWWSPPTRSSIPARPPSRS